MIVKEPVTVTFGAAETFGGSISVDRKKALNAALKFAERKKQKEEKSLIKVFNPREFSIEFLCTSYFINRNMAQDLHY